MNRIVALLIMSLVASTAFAQKYTPGYYYTKSGEKVDGLLRFNFIAGIVDDKSDGKCSVSFKKSKKDDKTVLTTRDICCFVIKGDSFAIIKDIEPKAGLFNSTYPQDFAKVIEVGKINLYKYYSFISNGQFSYTLEEWIVERDGKQEKLTQLHFEDQMAEFVGDYPALLERVKRNQLTYSNAKDDTRAIIKFYNEWAKMVPK